MATAFDSIGAPARAIPVSAFVPTTHANDNAAARWTDDPRARLLLASCAACPPRGEWKRTRYVQTHDEWFEYVGYRAEALAAIRMEHGERANAAYHAHGEVAYPAFAAWCAEPTATAAIDDALTAALAAIVEG